MTRIDINTDGIHYKHLVHLHEKQIEALKPYEAREKQAYEAYDKAICDSIMNTPADADELAELLRNEENAIREYRVAIENGRDASKRAVATAVELVAELIHDNIDTLDGKCLNSKAVFIALNEALPEDIYISTNRITEDTVLYVEVGASSLRFAQYLHPNSGDTHIRPCRTDSDIISKQRFMKRLRSGHICSIEQKQADGEHETPPAFFYPTSITTEQAPAPSGSPSLVSIRRGDIKRRA